MNTPIKRLFICATSVMTLASCGGGNDVASGGAGTGVTSASAVTASAPNGAAANSATSNSAVSTSVTSTKAAMDRVGNCPPPSTTPACQNLSCLPTPAQFTTNSTASGTLTYKVLLPAGSNAPTTLTLSSNFTDLLTSNYVAGALIGRMISDTYPGVQFNKDYLYGTLFAQLLQESNGANNYSNVGPRQNWIIQDPATLAPLMAATQGGPYQINSYPQRLEYYSATAPAGMAAPMGLGLANYTALQQGLNYSIYQQDNGCQGNNVAPDSLDSKYFGPLAAAYYSFNDIFAAKQYQDPNSAPINICLKNLNQANITAQSANNIFDVLLSTLYNSGITSSITTRIEAICAAISPSPSPTQLAALQALADYTLNPTLYSAATGISSLIDVQHFDYARDARFTLDQLYNLVPTTKLPDFVNNRSISLSVQDIATVFANAFGTLSYVNSVGQYGYIASADSNKAFATALTTTGLTMGSFLNISNSPTDRAKFFDLLDAAIINLEKSLINSNFTGFNATTQSTLPGMPTAAPQINPALTK
jgi:hypothetical protein